MPKPDERILLGHGSGGKLTHRLLKEMIFPAFNNPVLKQADDAAVLDVRGKVAFTTDSFVVNPIFFPGGDIGKLAVCGTVNDLAVMGAKPLYLTAACIVEEGFQTALLAKIIRSMAETARKAGVQIVGGDLKVVEKNACDRIFINTTGIGRIPAGRRISANNARVGDVIIINGTVGDHGASVMAARQDYKLRTALTSDCASLTGLIACALKTTKRISVMRDPTRGGVATTLNEIAAQSKVTIRIKEEKIPVKAAVRGLCELLGIEPLYMANEGKVLIFAHEQDAPKILAALRAHPLGKHAAVIGQVTGAKEPGVLMETAIGSTRILDMLTAEQLPRIC